MLLNFNFEVWLIRTDGYGIDGDHSLCVVMFVGLHCSSSRQKFHIAGMEYENIIYKNILD